MRVTHTAIRTSVARGIYERDAQSKACLLYCVRCAGSIPAVLWRETGHEILREDFKELGGWLDSNYFPETKDRRFYLIQTS